MKLYQTLVNSWKNNKRENFAVFKLWRKEKKWFASIKISMKFNYCLLILFCRFSFFFFFMVFWLSLLFASKFSVQTKSHVFLKSSVCSALRVVFVICSLWNNFYDNFSLFSWWHFEYFWVLWELCAVVQHSSHTA